MSEKTETPQPAANSNEAFKSAIDSYKHQQGALAGQLAQLEQNYTQQKEQMVSTLHMLSGAIAAIEQLVQNVADEAAAKNVGSGSDTPDPSPATDEAPVVA